MLICRERKIVTNKFKCRGDENKILPLFLNIWYYTDFFHSFDYSSFLQIILRIYKFQVKSKVHVTIDIMIYILL
jgi:hypothetical protein